MRNKLPIIFLAVIIATQICGCGDKDFSEGEVLPLSGGANIKEEAVAIPENPERGESTEQNNRGVEISNTALPESEEVQITIRVDNLNAYYNEQRLNYKQGDLSTLQAVLKEQLAGIEDNTPIVLDYEYGDDEVCTAIDAVIQQLGLSSAVVRSGN